jgi:hypothetical protein
MDGMGSLCSSLCSCNLGGFEDVFALSAESCREEESGGKVYVFMPSQVKQHLFSIGITCASHMIVICTFFNWPVMTRFILQNAPAH